MYMNHGTDFLFGGTYNDGYCKMQYCYSSTELTRTIWSSFFAETMSGTDGGRGIRFHRWEKEPDIFGDRYRRFFMEPLKAIRNLNSQFSHIFKQDTIKKHLAAVSLAYDNIRPLQLLKSNFHTS